MSSSSAELPQYQLEGDGYSNKVVVNSIARFRLRLLSPIHPQHRSTIFDFFSVSILDPFSHSIVVQRRLLSTDLLELTYQPMSIGQHQLSITFNDKIDRQLVLNVIDDETNLFSTLKPFGPGLQRAIVGLPTEFYVHLHSPTVKMINEDHLQFSLKPSFQAEIDYEKQIATVRYTPMEEGQCPIQILECNKNILHSPFLTHVRNVLMTNGIPRLRVLDLPTQIIIHRPVEFQVDIDHPVDELANSLCIEVLNEDTSPRVFIQPNENYSRYKCSFIPESLTRHILSIDYGGIVAEQNPFYCDVIQEKDIQLMGPAMTNQCLTLNEPTHFYFKLKDFLPTNDKEKNITYESGYSSNDDNSAADAVKETTEEIEENNYRVTITDSQGHVKSNVSIQELLDKANDNVRVDFVPDEKILFINISCTW